MNNELDRYGEAKPMKYVLEHPQAVPPQRASAGAVGFDLTAVSVTALPDGILEYDTGVSIELEEGWAGIISPRSSISKYSLYMSNSIGVIDVDYRGTLKVRFKVTGHNVYKVGDRVAQLVVIPFYDGRLKKATSLSKTERDRGGFGSSGV